MADLSLISAGKSLLTAIVPKSQDQRLADVKATFFGESWPKAPDEQGIFSTNGDSWAATNYLDVEIYYRGAILRSRHVCGIMCSLQTCAL